eukprot:GHVU01124324.1.p1 GENE.GHVU01124324.1~~GHVU01124324.1.p1  ORF type:complete len:208 (-),score=29.84 GHVU01124324.1:1115-1738(-)
MGTTDPADHYDHLFKFLLVGDAGVGKSSILLRFTDDTFNMDQLATIGVDFKVKIIKVRDSRLKLAIWDTAGQERFRTLTVGYYRGAQAIILVYDVCQRSTFDSLDYWLSEFERYVTNQEAVKMLVANKVDKPTQERLVSREEGEKFAIEHSMLFVETSAVSNEGIDLAFNECANKILDTPSLFNAAGSADNRTLSTEDEGASGGCAC